MARSNAAKIPEEIIFDILLCLPAKFIGQCRCVSKQWRKFLSDPQFIKAHLALRSHKHEEDKLIVVDCSLHTITFTHNPKDDFDAISRKLDFQHLSDNWVSVDGSCNGLILAINRERVKYLINPTTLKYHKIPNFHLALPVPGSFSMYGFGYDVVSDDYKVVALSYYNAVDETVIVDTFVDIYSVRKGLWRRLEISPYDHSVTDLASGVLVNGALHWLASSKTSDESCVIAAFHLSDEKFLEVPVPSMDYNYSLFELVALRGRLCMFTNLTVDTITICLMEDNGVKESWTIFRLMAPSLHDYFWTPLCSMTDDDIVMDVEEKLVLYNMKENELWDLMVDVSPALDKARTLIESLVCPSFGNGTEG
ncbi:F-box/kelch-repeat protein At3g06240-like [Nicotiana tomentosiformis]|uniref:F-box/kelch-repeat protein At3g06240-like n=1 Tax=Nicotiana tomentosiformis TaxID=4098 RepID=UPI00051C1953|nr:F-box/kelch-repeat protein At3g06240-like [Nicotiana tomentosiformis]XP_009630550.1 F-box/kelch-repeat protein At3g06240-like [Nicotiana tomentosiformis]